MSRPTSKTQLLEQTRKNYTTLQSEITKLSPDVMTIGGVVGEWSVKDVLAHLIAWQQMVLTWYRKGKQNEVQRIPSEKYTWREIPALNQEIYENHRHQPLDEVLTEFAASHQETVSEIETMSDRELFTPQVYAWTKSTTLGSYFTSAMSSHYDWASKEIRRGLKNKQRR